MGNIPYMLLFDKTCGDVYLVYSYDKEEENCDVLVFEYDPYTEEGFISISGADLGAYYLGVNCIPFEGISEITNSSSAVALMKTRKLDAEKLGPRVDSVEDLLPIKAAEFENRIRLSERFVINDDGTPDYSQLTPEERGAIDDWFKAEQAEFDSVTPDGEDFYDLMRNDEYEDYDLNDYNEDFLNDFRDIPSTKERESLINKTLTADRPVTLREYKTWDLDDSKFSDAYIGTDDDDEYEDEYLDSLNFYDDGPIENEDFYDTDEDENDIDDYAFNPYLDEEEGIGDNIIYPEGDEDDFDEVPDLGLARDDKAAGQWFEKKMKEKQQFDTAEVLMYFETKADRDKAFEILLDHEEDVYKCDEHYTPAFPGSEGKGAIERGLVIYAELFGEYSKTKTDKMNQEVQDFVEDMESLLPVKLVDYEYNALMMESKKSNGARITEGAGAGYSIIFKDVKLEDVEITDKRKMDEYEVYSFKASIKPQEYDWAAVGYDWDMSSDWCGELVNISGTVEGEYFDYYGELSEDDVKHNVALYDYNLGNLHYGGGWSHIRIPQHLELGKDWDVDLTDDNAGTKNAQIEHAELDIDDADIMNAHIEQIMYGPFEDEEDEDYVDPEEYNKEGTYEEYLRYCRATGGDPYPEDEWRKITGIYESKKSDKRHLREGDIGFIFDEQAFKDSGIYDKLVEVYGQKIADIFLDWVKSPEYKDGPFMISYEWGPESASISSSDLMNFDLVECSADLFGTLRGYGGIQFHTYPFSSFLTGNYMNRELVQIKSTKDDVQFIGKSGLLNHVNGNAETDLDEKSLYIRKREPICYVIKETKQGKYLMDSYVDEDGWWANDLDGAKIFTDMDKAAEYLEENNDVEGFDLNEKFAIVPVYATEVRE